MSTASAHSLRSGWLTPSERRHAVARSLPVGLAIFAAHIAFYGVTLWAAVADFPWWITVPAAVLNGIAIGLLFLLGHDTSHGNYAPGRRTNQVLTRIGFFPIFHSASLWEVYHNRLHHGGTNLKGFDSVWVPMSKDEYDRATPVRRFLYRMHRGWFGPISYYTLDLWLTRLILPVMKECRGDRARHIFDTVFVIAAFVVTLTGIAWLGSVLAPGRPVWLTLLQGWLLPYVVWTYLISFSVYLNHTHPDVHWFADKARWKAYNASVRATTHIELPDFIKVFPIWQIAMHHTAHHVLPAIPIYKLDAAQLKLLAAIGENVCRYRLTFSEYRRILRVCKLYDTERQCWTDFEGRPTSAVLTLPGPAEARTAEPALA